MCSSLFSFSIKKNHKNPKINEFPKDPFKKKEKIWYHKDPRTLSRPLQKEKKRHDDISHGPHKTQRKKESHIKEHKRQKPLNKNNKQRRHQANSLVL
jgi:hypothetical protein